MSSSSLVQPNRAGCYTLRALAPILGSSRVKRPQTFGRRISVILFLHEARRVLTCVLGPLGLSHLVFFLSVINILL